MCRKALWGSKGEDTTPRYVMPRLPHKPLGWIPSWKKLCTHVGEGPRAREVWKKKPDNWPKVNKSPEELPYINDLTTSLAVLLVREITHTLPLWVHISAPLPPYLNKLTLCVHSDLLCCVSNNKPHKDTTLETLAKSTGASSHVCSAFPITVLLFSLPSASSSEFILVKAGKDRGLRP